MGRKGKMSAEHLTVGEFFAGLWNMLMILLRRRKPDGDGGQ